MPDRPPGIFFLRRFLPMRSRQAYKIHALALTFVTYTVLHAARKPPSIVKDALSFSDGTGWAPFDGENGGSLLGGVDTAYLLAYALGMFYTGHMADRINMRYFLTAGMLGTSLCVAMLGAAYFLNVHSYAYFLFFSMMSGFFQSIGWPVVVCVVGNWFGKSQRGLIMGAWNSHAFLGNIIGAALCAAVLPWGWGWAYVVPAAMVALVSMAVFLLQVNHPEDVDMPAHGDLNDSPKKTDRTGHTHEEELPPIGFMRAWAIPGVVEYSLSLFCAKCINAIFFYWLPFYFAHTVIGGQTLSGRQAGNLSAAIDVGGLAGGILAGMASDRSGASAITTAAMGALSVPCLWLYRFMGSESLLSNLILLLLVGFFTNGPYALVSTVVAADLGTHMSLEGNARALATVTGIIDGVGSIGAVFGPLVVGWISGDGNNEDSWNNVFYLLMALSLLEGLLLWRVIREEITTWRKGRQGAAEKLYGAHGPKENTTDALTAYDSMRQDGSEEDSVNSVPDTAVRHTEVDGMPQHRSHRAQYGLNDF